MSPSTEIERCRRTLNEWLLTSYAGLPNHGEFGRPYYGERDIGFEGWGEIYQTVGRVFTDRLWNLLPLTAQHDILFFISRENEGGALISWLASVVAGPLSNVGDLSEQDFLSICRTCLEMEEDCADYVLASKFATLPNPRPEHFILLEAFFSRKNCYTRRRALVSLEALGSTTIFEKAVSLFSAENADQWDRSVCLSILAKLPENQAAFDRHLAEYDRIYAGDEHAPLLVEKMRRRQP